MLAPAGRNWALNLEAQKVAKPDTHQPACDGSGRTAVPLIIDRLPYVRSTVLVPLLSCPRAYDESCHASLPCEHQLIDAAPEDGMPVGPDG